MTGSGKSYLARRILSTNRPLAIIDPKREFEYKGLKIYDNPDSIKLWKPEHFIYRPDLEHMYDHDSYDKVYKYIFESKFKYQCYTDEIVSILHHNEPPKGFQLGYQLGRSKGKSMLTSTQRAKRIPLFVKNDSTHFYLFYNGIDEDHINDFTPYYSKDSLDEYEFWYWKNHSRFKPVKMKYVKEIGG